MSDLFAENTRKQNTAENGIYMYLQLTSPKAQTFHESITSTGSENPREAKKAIPSHFMIGMLMW